MKKVLSILDKLGFSVILASATMIIVGALIMLKTLPENMDYHAVMSAPIIGASVEAL